MKTLTEKIRRAIVTNIPGSEAQAGANLAKEKRLLERELRNSGYSRSHAVAEVSRRFKNVNTL